MGKVLWKREDKVRPMEAHSLGKLRHQAKAGVRVTGSGSLASMAGPWWEAEASADVSLHILALLDHAADSLTLGWYWK